MNFREWLAVEGSNPGAKTGLYPLGYGGIGLYPDAWYPTRSADAIYYMSIDERIYKGNEGKPFDITRLPPRSDVRMNAGEGGVWDIRGLKGGQKGAAVKKDAANSGDGGMWDIRRLN